MAAHSLTIVHHMLRNIHEYETSDITTGQTATYLLKIALNAVDVDKMVTMKRHDLVLLELC